MTARLRDCLDRTLLLMRDELRDDVNDSDLLSALMGTDIVLCADANNLSSHSAQCAYVTAAILMARSGQRIYLAAPDIPLIGRQPPLRAGSLVSALVNFGSDLLPGLELLPYAPSRIVDLCVTFGDSRPMPARRVISLNGAAWSGALSEGCSRLRWEERDWPFGGLAAGALASGEAFKATLQKLRVFARNPSGFDELTAPSRNTRFQLAPPNAARSPVLGSFDLISGGAIAQATLFCVSRILGVVANGRIIDDSKSDLTNMNRYMLLTRSEVTSLKVDQLARLDLGSLRLSRVPMRYNEATCLSVAPLSPRVLVGVDHIPSRWLVQRMHGGWLGIGATTHWSAMTSFHDTPFPCAWCMHPEDDPNDAPIPTVAFVSFWSGLLLATYFVRAAAGEVVAPRDQHIYITPLRPESAWRGPIARRTDCPLCGHAAGSRVA